MSPGSAGSGGGADRESCVVAYAIRRILLMIPTLLAIMVVNFIIVQAAPGGPVEQMIARFQGTDVAATQRVTGGGGELAPSAAQPATGASGGETRYRGARGLDPAFIKELERAVRLRQAAARTVPLDDEELFDLRFRDQLFSRPQGRRSDHRQIAGIDLDRAVDDADHLSRVDPARHPQGGASDGSQFDVWTSGVIIFGYAVPSFLFAVLLIVLFAGGSYWSIFPLRGLVSDNWASLPWPGRILDYFWHIALPITALVIGGFATLTMLTKNSFLDEINKQYVLTARAKGLTERRVLYGHVFRNAMLLVVAGFPAAFIGILFTGSLLIEVIFSLDGLGLLGFEAAINRDYPIMFGTLYVFTLIGLVLKLVSDLTYMMIDPRIDFERRAA